jgi:thymidylate synthase
MHHEDQYLDLLDRLLEEGQKKKDRTGTGTRSLFSQHLRINMQDGFPILTTKEVNYKAAMREMDWVLSGGSNILPLLKQGIRWWTDWPLRRYLEYTDREGLQEVTDPNTLRIDTTAPWYRLAKSEFEEGLITGKIDEEWGDLGHVYGRNLRAYEVATDPQVWSGNVRIATVEFQDQLQEVIRLLNKDPDSRRIVMTMWHPGHTDAMLPPCHGIAIQFYTRWDEDLRQRRISMHMTQRSADVFLGVPVNIVMYAYLLEMVAVCTGFVTEEMSILMVDCHLYENHVEAAMEQVKRLPSAKRARFCTVNNLPRKIGRWQPEDSWIEDYEPQGPIRAPIAV